MAQIGRLNIVATADIGGAGTGDVETPNTGEVQLFFEITATPTIQLAAKKSDGTVVRAQIGEANVIFA
jgi:hypothetical protein